MADDENEAVPMAEAEPSTVRKQRGGVWSRMWKALFRLGSDDFEKRLKYISTEEAAVISRIKNRSIMARNVTRYIVLFSVFLEVIAVLYAIVTTRTLDLDWKMRSFHVLPMFLLPCSAALAYSGFVNFTKLCDRKDEHTLESLRAERQAKIDELKERTNYYNTQQLIQRYDTDPAAKAAAATILASKLGAETGLKLFVEDESNLNATVMKSNDVELVQSNGIRNRKQPQTRSTGTVSNPVYYGEEEMAHSAEGEGLQRHRGGQLVVEHHSSQASAAFDGGWLSRLAAILVGEDPTQSYALICGNCHMHNGLAQKEDFPFITYYCPHCRALNQPKRPVGEISASNTQDFASLMTERTIETVSHASGSPRDGKGTIESVSHASGSPRDGIVMDNSPVKTDEEILNESVVMDNSAVQTSTEIEKATEEIAPEEVTS